MQAPCRNCFSAIIGLFLAVSAGPAPAHAAILLTSDSTTGTLQSLDPATGAATPIGSFGAGVRTIAGLAYDAATNRLYGTATDTGNLYRINPATGAPTLIGPLGGGDLFMHALAFDPGTGKLFGAYGPSEQNELYEINPQTGAASRIGTIGFFTAAPSQSVSGLAVHPVTHELYGSLSGPGETGGLVRINKATGAGTLIGPSARISGLAFHPDTAVLYGIDNGLFSTSPDALYTVNLTSGAATLVGRPGLGNPLGLEFLPEPSGGVIAFIAALGCLARPRRAGRD